jgi:hypothetical protein
MLDTWWRTTPRVPELLADLPTQENACRIAVAPGDAGPERTRPPGTPASEGRTAGGTQLSWWSAWKRYVFYAVAHANRPQPGPPSPCNGEAECLQLADEAGNIRASGKEFAVLVAGAPIATGASAQAHDASSISDVNQWLEAPNATLRGMNPNPEAGECPPSSKFATCAPISACSRVAGGRPPSGNDVVVSYP